MTDDVTGKETYCNSKNVQIFLIPRPEDFLEGALTHL